MTDTPDQGQAPLYTSETPSHVPTRTPTEPNVVKRDDGPVSLFGRDFGPADVDDDV